MKDKKSTLYVFSIIATVLNFILLFEIIYFLDDSAYGNFIYFHSIATILASLASLRLELVITDAHNINKAISWMIYPIVISSLLSFLSVIIISFFIDLTSFEFLYIALISLLICSYSCLQQFYIIRDKHFINSILLVLVPLINVVLTYFFNEKTDVLLYSNLLAYSITIFTGFLIFFYFNYKLLIKGFKFIPLKYSDYKRYLIFSYPIGVISSYNINFVNIIIGNVFGLSILGVFSVANKIISVPFSSIGSVWSSLSRADFSREFSNKKKVKKAYMTKFFKKTSYISIISSLLMITCALILIKSFEFFNKYDGLDLFVTILIPVSIITFIIQSLNSILVTANLTNFYLKLNSLSFITLLLFYLITNKFIIEISEALILYNILYFITLIFIIYQINYRNEIK